MATEAPRLRKVTGRGEWKGERFARLECGHQIAVPPTEPMPYEAHCPTCDPEPERELVPA